MKYSLVYLLANIRVCIAPVCFKCYLFDSIWEKNYNRRIKFQEIEFFEDEGVVMGTVFHT